MHDAFARPSDRDDDRVRCLARDRGGTFPSGHGDWQDVPGIDPISERGGQHHDEHGLLAVLQRSPVRDRDACERGRPSFEPRLTLEEARQMSALQQRADASVENLPPLWTDEQRRLFGIELDRGRSPVL